MGNETLTNPGLIKLLNTLDKDTTGDNWHGVAEALKRFLNTKQRAALAYACLSRLPDHDAEIVIAAASPLSFDGEVLE